MDRNLELKIGSTVYGKIMGARMSEHERRTALHAMGTASDILAGCAWLTRKIEHFGARLFFKPSLKH
jgi:hypothetical protein